MKINSVRVRLTLWFTGVLALVIVLFAVTVYFLVAQVVSKLTESGMQSAGDALIAVINAEKDEDDEGKSDAEIFNEKIREDFRFRDLAFVIFDKNRNVVAESFQESRQANSASPEFAGAVAQLPREIIISAAGNADTFQTFTLAQGNEVKVYVQRINFNGENYSVAVLRLLGEQEQLFKKIRLIFFTVIPLSVLVSLLGGYYLARKSLAPIVEMSEKAARISSSNLNERLPVANAKDELGELATIFNQMLTRLELSFNRQKQFMADASHELRTPVSITLGESEVALANEKRTSEDYRESLSIVRDESLRMKRLIEDLFMLSRADAGQITPQNSEFLLDAAIDDCVRKIRFLARNVTISSSCETEMPFFGDEDFIRRLILNLLDNALKFTKNKISIDAAKKGGFYIVTVTDNGKGISESDRANIFERFYRAEKSRTREGSGLGLSIARWIAEIHKGSLDLEKSNSDGSVFLLKLPIIDV